MSGNKRVRKSTNAKTARDLLSLSMDEPASPAAAARKPRVLKDKEQVLKGELHRLEVEIAESSRYFVEERRRRIQDELPPPDRAMPRRRKDQRLTLAQKSEKQKVFYMQVLEFAVTALLFVGACAWLYQWWLSRAVS